MNHQSAAVTILTSGVGLGVYIPALLIQRQLRQLHFDADVEVLENYYTPARKQGHLAHKKAHHESFALAQMAHRMARDVQDCLDADRTEHLMRQWRVERRDYFIVWSGFWLPIVERYRQLLGAPIHVDHCRIDAAISASFKIFPHLQSSGRPIWLWNWEEKRIIHEIPVTDSAPVPFVERENRLAVHGGGWGIGTYRSKIPDLEQTGYALDVVIHEPDEARHKRPGDRCFMMDPEWHPWAGEFPPMAEVVDQRNIIYKRSPDVHSLYYVIRRCKAIVSKPGGCTLIDSLNSATPVILLEPYGYAEESNARIWEYLGFGISYPAWQATGYDGAVLEKLHANIMSRARTGIDYPRAYAEQFS